MELWWIVLCNKQGSTSTLRLHDLGCLFVSQVGCQYLTFFRFYVCWSELLLNGNTIKKNKNLIKSNINNVCVSANIILWKTARCTLDRGRGRSTFPGLQLRHTCHQVTVELGIWLHYRGSEAVICRLLTCTNRKKHTAERCSSTSLPPVRCHAFVNKIKASP